MKFLNKYFLMVLAVFLLMNKPVYSQNEPTPTNEWVGLFGQNNIFVNGELALPGDTVRAYDPDGVLAGQFIIKTIGKYGLMAVYGDDPFTEVDEGAEPGDSLTFKINDLIATPSGPDAPIWTSNGDVKEVGLSVIGANLELSTYEISFGDVNTRAVLSSEITLTSTGIEDLVIDSVIAYYNMERQLFVTELSEIVTSNEIRTLDIFFNPIVGTGFVEGKILIYSNAFAGSVISVPVSANLTNNILPTYEWINIYGNAGSTVDGRTLRTGDVIDVYDEDGIHIGSSTLIEDEKFGIMSVYRDDPFTDEDEGAEPGDTLLFTINSFPATSTDLQPIIWGANGDLIEVTLEASTNFWPEMISPPETIHFLQGSVFEFNLWDDITEQFIDPENQTLSFSVSSDHSLVLVSLVESAVKVKLDPEFHGNSNIVLTVSDGINKIHFYVSLYIEEPVPQISSSSTTINFGNVIVSTTVDTLIRIYNPGNGVLNISGSSTLTNDLSSSILDTTIPVSDSLDVIVTLSPVTVGSFSDVLSIENNSPVDTYEINVLANIILGSSNEPIGDLPVKFGMDQNYPNPFNPNTNINFGLAKSSTVSLKIFNMLGQEVATLLSNEFRPSGHYSITFDASSLSSGTYIYSITTEEGSITKKMMLIK